MSTSANALLTLFSFLVLIDPGSGNLLSWNSLAPSSTPAYSESCNSRGRYIQFGCICDSPYYGRWCQFESRQPPSTSTSPLGGPRVIRECNWRGRWNQRTQSCECEADYFGHSCQFTVETTTTPSSNYCLRFRGQWNNVLKQCVCRKNYYGLHCEYVRNCLHGTSFDDECRCDYGWEGEACDQIKCFYGTPIKNFTECTCNPGVGGMYCDGCLHRYRSPPNCDMAYADSDRPLKSESNCQQNLFNYYLNIFLLLLIAIYFTVDRIYKRRTRRRLELARERGVLAPLTPEMEELLADKYIFPSHLQPCPRYDEAVRYPVTSEYPPRVFRMSTIEEDELETDPVDLEPEDPRENEFIRVPRLHV